MQLNGRPGGACFARARVVAALVVGASVGAVDAASAQVTFNTTTTFFHESGGPLDMTVVTPSASLAAEIEDTVGIRAAYEADVVSGASVAVVDAPGGNVDAVTSATKLDDVRHTVTGGLSLSTDYATLRAGYTYGVEEDYRSHGVSVGGSTELFERDTTLDVAFARGIDTVCNLFQPRAEEAVDRQRLPTSEGCFKGVAMEREDLSLDLMTVQGGWTQAWTPIFTTQATITAQLLHGYQGNPYRSVWLGRSAAQEHHPEDRARYAAALSGRVWIEKLDAAAQVSVRGYRDSWNVQSITAELAWEQRLLEGLRIRVRGRYYTQTAALFYSDDYTFMPRGAYFTGDRELSAMDSVTIGGRIAFSTPPDDDGDVLGFLTRLDLVGKVDLVMHGFDGFRYGQAAVPNADALVVTGGLEAEL